MATKGFKTGLTFDPYQITAPLAEGGMGKVWRAEHRGLKRAVVIKTLHPDLAEDQEALQRFLREGEAAARIHHPHVVEIHDVGMHDGCPYLVMEALDGEDLGARLSRERILPVQELAELMLPVCAAVSAAHVEGVVHRDLKPENIFLSRTREGLLHPKVLDFGISRVVNDHSGRVRTQTDYLLGTPRYMSPEQARGERIIDDRSDQWSLGVILYECSTGRAPVPEGAPLVTVARIVAGNFPRPRELRPALSAAFEAVVLRAMALRADERFPSVRDLGAALMPFAGERAQVVWAEVFTGAAPDRRATWSVEGDLGLGSRLSVPEREGPDDTLLDEGAEREGTTVPMRATRRRGWRWLVIAAVVVGVLFVVDWIVWGE